MSAADLNAFLAAAERRAYLHARFAVRNEQTALDIVQDSMLKLAERYAERPAEEWPLLFQRILQNTIRDHFRRQKVRDTWTALVSTLLPRQHADDGDDDGFLDRIANSDSHGASAESEFASRETLALIADAIAALPLRQRQAFLLRYWEGHDINETARVMQCSEGSVKTHCSRATQALAETLRAKGLDT